MSNTIFRFVPEGMSDVKGIAVQIASPFEQFDDFYQSYPAAPSRALMSPDGQTITLIYRFANMVAPDDWRVDRLMEIARLTIEPVEVSTPPEIDGHTLRHKGTDFDLDNPEVVDHLENIIKHEPIEPDQTDSEPIEPDDVPLAGVTNIRNEEWDRQFKSAGLKLLYFALIRHCGGKDWCLVGQERLALDTSSSVRQVQRWDKELKAMRLVKIEPHQYMNLNRYKLPELKRINWRKAKEVWRARRS
jgi:hypothetical protein